MSIPAGTGGNTGASFAFTDMKLHARLLLSAIGLATLGAGLFHELNPKGGTVDASLPRPQLPPALRSSQTSPPGSNQGNHPGRSGHAHSRETAAEPTPENATPPPTWADAKARVEQVRERFHARQRKMAVERYDQTRAARDHSEGGETRTAPTSDLSGEVAGELPPIIVPFDPKNPSLPAPLPAVLAEFPEAGGITPEQQAGVNQLAEDFLEAVADPLADPTDPVYQKRWQQAQLTADQLFRLRYGDFAWMLRHNAAHREAHGASYGK